MICWSSSISDVYWEMHPDAIFTFILISIISYF